MGDPYLDEYLKTIVEQLKNKYSINEIKSSFESTTKGFLYHSALLRLMTSIAILTLGPIIVSALMIISVFLGGDTFAYIFVMIGIGSLAGVSYLSFINSITPKKTLLSMISVSIYLSFIAYYFYQALHAIITKTQDQTTKALEAKGQSVISAIFGSPENLLPLWFFIGMIIVLYAVFPLAGLLKK